MHERWRPYFCALLVFPSQPFFPPRLSLPQRRRKSRGTCSITSKQIGMANLLVASWSVLLLSSITYAQQECYFGPGSEFRGPTNLVPCASTGSSACCLLGDTCLSGNACYNGATGNTYQYGCTDITYTDSTCPYKCGFDPSEVHLSIRVDLTDSQKETLRGSAWSSATMSQACQIRGSAKDPKIVAVNGRRHTTC